ncbi:MAG: hypothetical protein IPH78_02275 [Bacteroidetes bacterium]|nr:hypothetical protein [Bacteroidota bacterium]
MKFALKICLLVLLAAGSTQARAQGASEQTHEIGVWGGITNYFGDLNTKTSFKFVRPGAGVFYRYNIKYRGAWRTSVNWGTAEFDDAQTNIAWNRQRNLSFRSQIFDISSVIEFNFFKYDKGSKKHWYTPFIGTGIALFFFNPQAQYNGKWYYLQPLGTEGQNDPSYSGVKKYRLFNFAIPIVGGFKFSFKRNWNIAIEAGVRKTFTDYLDDVSGKYPSYASLPGGSGGLAGALSDRSGEVGEKIGKPGYQRGQSPKKDDYFFGGISISYTIMKARCPTTSGVSTYK